MSTEKEKNATWDALESLTFKNRIKELEYDCAELTKQNEQLRERCKELATRMPEWPKGYRPTRKVHTGEKKRYNERSPN